MLYRILECDEEITVTSCYYTSLALFPSEFNCELGIKKDSTFVLLEENEKSWIEVKFDEAYNLESLKLSQMYAPMGAEQPSIIVWLEFSDGERILATAVDLGKSVEEIVFVNLIQTSSIKIGIESVKGSVMGYSLTKLEIFGCSLSK